MPGFELDTNAKLGTWPVKPRQRLGVDSRMETQIEVWETHSKGVFLW